MAPRVIADWNLILVIIKQNKVTIIQDINKKLGNLLIQK